MVIETLKPVLYKCTRCGATTEWEPELGPDVLCVKCWDRAADKYIKDIISATKRRWYAEHKEEAAATKRRWYAEHKEEVAATKRRWYAEHKEEAEKH